RHRESPFGTRAPEDGCAARPRGEPVNVSPHPIDELPGMLRGELTLDQLRAVTVHLRTCEECRRALVELTAGAAATARGSQYGLVDRVSAPLPPLELPADADVSADTDQLGVAREV